MRELLTQAKPIHLAFIGVVPFLVGMAVMVAQPPGALAKLLFAGAIYFGVFMVLIWSWIIGHALNERIEPTLRPDTSMFRIASIFVAAYTALFLFNTAIQSRSFFLAQTPLLFFAFHLIAALAMVRILHFISTNLALAEGTEIAPASWATTLSLFSVGGILPIQKRINQIFGEH